MILRLQLVLAWLYGTSDYFSMLKSIVLTLSSTTLFAYNPRTGGSYAPFHGVARLVPFRAWGVVCRAWIGMVAPCPAAPARRQRYGPGPRSGRTTARRSRLPLGSELGGGRGEGRLSHAGATDGSFDPLRWGSGCGSRPSCGRGRDPSPFWGRARRARVRAHDRAVPQRCPINHNTA